MKQLCTYIQALLTLTIVSAMLVCCTERLSSSHQEPTDGRAAVIEITLSTDSKSTPMTDENSAINKLTVVVFNNKGERVDIASLDYTNSPIRLTTVSGSNSRIVTVANADDALTQKLKATTAYTQLAEQLVIEASGNSANIGNLLMVADSQVDIKPGNNTLSLPLQFVSAKVSIRIEDHLTGGESFTINSCKLVNVPLSSYLLGRIADNERQYTDRYVAHNSKDGQTTVDLFMLENRRGIRAKQPDETQGQEHLNKRRYAPKDASHIVVNATHRTANGTASFDMYLYLGQNNSTDYNVKRSEHHKYTIRVKGFNNISIDSNIEYNDNNFDVAYGDDLRFDAHPDTRQLLFKNGEGKINVEIRDSNGRTFDDPNFDAHWVKISPMDLIRPQIRQKGQGQNTRWQQQGEKGTFVRGKYIPHKSARAQLSGGGWNEVDVENDDVMSYAQATRRMCYKITDIAINSTKPNALYIHTDNNPTQAERRAQITLSCTGSDGKTKTQLVTIYQLGAIYMGTINGRKLYIETKEESGINIYCDKLPFLNINTTMQWGYMSGVLYKGNDNFTNGAFLTASAVYGSGHDSWVKNNNNFVQKNADGSPKFDELNYRPKYGSGLNGFDLVSEPYNEGQLSTSNAPYFNPTPKSWAITFHPIYGSSAARYCHEKNRDKNGDGVIDDSESEWFLPAFNELEHIWIAQNGVKPEARMSLDKKYWSATEYSIDRAFAISMQNGAMYEMLSKASDARVRCARLGEPADQVVELGAGGSVIINNGDLPTGAVSSTSKGPAATSASMNETLYRKLAVAKEDINNVTWSKAMGYADKYNYTTANNATPDQDSGCKAYSEATDGSDKGRWRVPTSRELVRIYLLAELLAAKSPFFTPLSSARYWSSSEDEPWSAWSINMSPESTPQHLVPQVSSRGAIFTARCVREVL